MDRNGLNRSAGHAPGQTLTSRHKWCLSGPVRDGDGISARCPGCIRRRESPHGSNVWGP